MPAKTAAAAAAKGDKKGHRPPVVAVDLTRLEGESETKKTKMGEKSIEEIFREHKEDATFSDAKEKMEEDFQDEAMGHDLDFLKITKMHHVKVNELIHVLISAKFDDSDARLKYMKTVRETSQLVVDQVIRLEAQKSKVVNKHLEGVVRLISNVQDYASFVEWCCTVELVFGIIGPKCRGRKGNELDEETLRQLGRLIHAYKNLAVATRNAFKCTDAGWEADPLKEKEVIGLEDLPDFVGDGDLAYFTENAAVFAKYADNYTSALDDDDEDEEEEDEEDEE